MTLLDEISTNPNLSSVELNNLHFVICGAALTIQSAWRIYWLNKSCRMSSKLNVNTTNEHISATKIQALWRGAKCRQKLLPQSSNQSIRRDVEVIVEQTETFLCHSIVLWHNSGYFKEKLLASMFCESSLNESPPIYKFELPMSISRECWRTIQNYFYGHEIKIYDRASFNQVMNASVELDIERLTAKLKKFILKSNLSDTTIVNKNNNNTDLDYFVDNDHEFNQPLQFLSHYYKFFKCVLSLYLKNKLNLQQTELYLSPHFINYEKMNEKEIKKCIYLLKTRLKSQNSSLVCDLIEVFLSKKN